MHFWPTWTKLWQSTASGTAIGYVFALPLLCLVAAVGTDLRRGPELPIHDRETDKIVGCIGLFVALGLQSAPATAFRRDLRTDAYRRHRSLGIRLERSGSDVRASVRSIGTGQSGWSRSSLAPLHYRAIATEMGGTRFDYSVLMVLVASAATTIAVSRTWRRGAIAFVAATVLGVVILYFTIQKYPTAPLFAVQLFPALGTAIVVGGAFYLYERRGKSLKPFDRPLRKPSTATSNWTILAVFAAAVLMFFTPLPSTSLTVNVGPPPATADPRLVVPLGLASDWSIRIRLAPSLLRQHLRTESSDHSGRHSESRLGLTDAASHGTD